MFSPFIASETPRNRTRGLTLIELLISMSLLAISSAFIYDFTAANLSLAVKNTSLNNSNTSLQQSYTHLLSALEGSCMFVDCANYNSTTKTFAPVANGVWGNSVRFMRLLPVSAYILPVDNSGLSLTNPPAATRAVYYPANQSTIQLSYNSSLYSLSTMPASTRIYLSYPNVSETVAGGTSPGKKPGLGISVASMGSGLMVLNPDNPLPANTVLDCNRTYLMVEAAFAVIVDPNDGHKSILYFEDTAQTANPVVVCQNLDPANQTQPNDLTIPTGGTAGTFSMNATGDTVQALLPIRDREFNNVVERSGGKAARNNTWLNINSKFRLRQEL